MLILTTSALMALIPSLVSGAPAAASPSQLASTDDLSGLSLNSPSTPQTSEPFDFSDPKSAATLDDEDDFMFNDDSSDSASAADKIKSTAPFGKKATAPTSTISDEDFFASLGSKSVGSKKLSDTTYTVIIKTGDKFGSGTGAHVFVQLGDAQGNTVNSFLSSRGHFSRKKVDAFKITSSKFLDEVCSLVIGHDNSHFYAPWFVDFVTVQRDSDSWSFPINKWIKTKTGENGRAIIAINRCNTGEELEGLESAAMEAELGADAPTVPVPSGSDQAPAVTEEEDDWMMAPSATSTGPASFADDADAMPPIEDDEFDLPGADVLPLPEAAAAEVAAAVDATKTVPCTEEVAPVTTTPCPESSPTKTPCPEDTPMPSPCTEHPEMTETAEAPVVEVTTTPCPESTPTPIPAPIVGYGPVTPPLLPEEEEYPEVPESAVGPPPYVMPPPAPKGYGYGPVETPFPETEIIEEEYPAVPPPPSQGYSYGPVETPYPEILPPMEEEYEYGPVETPTPVVPKGYGYGPVETPFPETEEEEEEYPETPYAPPPPHHEYGYGPVETPFPPTPTGYGYGPVGTPFPEEDEYITETPLPQVVPLPPKGYGYGPVETPFPEQDLLIPTPTPSIPKKKKKCVHKKKHTGYAGGALPPVGTPLPGAIEDDFMGQLPKGLTDDEDNMSDMPEDMMDMAMGEDMMDDMTVSPQEKKASKEYELPYAKSH